MSKENNSQGLEATIDAFNAGFTARDLNKVMEFFADDCEFRDLNGTVAKGKDQIRKAFQPLFDGAFGRVEFISKNLIIDEEKKEASFVWNCQHILEDSSGLSVKNKVLFSALKLMHGKNCYWEGVDYFIFNKDNKIVSKQSYGKASMPKFIRGLSKV